MSEAFDIEKYRSVGFVGCKLRGDRQTFQRDFERKTNSELDTYESLVKQGVQPDGTYTKNLDKAKALSDTYGFAYRGDNWSGQLEKHGLVESRPLNQSEKDAARRTASR